VLPVNDALRAEWRKGIEARFAESHPLRRWARAAEERGDAGKRDAEKPHGG
jgi:hypothetical protein